MRLLVSLAAVIVVALLALAGCNSKDKAGGNNSTATATRQTSTQPAQSQPNMPGDGVRRITTVELNDALNKGEAIVVDVRNDAAFRQAHVKGAILIPSNEVASHLSKLPHDKLIVTYCS